jgi:HK97 gp10 family phage protein
MNEETSLQIFGTKELSDLFGEMSTDVQKNIVISGFRKAGKIILDAAKANLTGVKGATKYQKSLGTKANSKDLTLEVGMKKGGVGWTGHFLDCGTVDRFYKTKSKSGLFRKSVKGTHGTGVERATGFFTNAVANTADQVQESIGDFIAERFDKLIEKYEGKPKN